MALLILPVKRFVMNFIIVIKLIALQSDTNGIRSILKLMDLILIFGQPSDFAFFENDRVTNQLRRTSFFNLVKPGNLDVAVENSDDC